MDLQIIDLARDLLLTVVIIAAPILLVGLVVGVAVSLFQALTSVQEQTLSLVPKMIAVIGMTFLLMAPAIALLRDYCLKVFAQLQQFGLS